MIGHDHVRIEEHVGPVDSHSLQFIFCDPAKRTQRYRGVCDSAKQILAIGRANGADVAMLTTVICASEAN